MGRRAAYVLTAAALTMCLAVSLASATLAASAAMSPSRPHSLDVAGDSPTDLTGMMPGDTRELQRIELRANGAVRYQMQVAFTGSQSLAETVLVVFIASDGRLLYQGSLAGARVGGPTLPAADDPALTAGQAETISVLATLPLDTPEGLSGAELRFTIVVQSYPDAS